MSFQILTFPEIFWKRHPPEVVRGQETDDVTNEDSEPRGKVLPVSRDGDY